MEFLDWLNNDYYNFLGVKHTATSEEIGKAYRAKAKLCHPDTYPLYSPERFQAEQDFKKLQLIKETLLDPLKKEEYDKERLFAQECYLNSMVYTFPVKAPEPPKNKFREILQEVEEKERDNSYIYDPETNTYHESSTFVAQEYLSPEEKAAEYKKAGAEKYYQLGMKAARYGDYNRAWVYFNSAKYLDPSLKVPHALWHIISKARHNP